MAGYHCTKYYYKYQERKAEIDQKYLPEIDLIEKQIQQALSEEEINELEEEMEEVEEEYNEELAELEGDAPISLAINYNAAEPDEYYVFKWITEGMHPRKGFTI